MFLLVHLFSVPLCLTSFGLSRNTRTRNILEPLGRENVVILHLVISSNIIHLVKFLREANELASQSETLSNRYIRTNSEISSERYSLNLTRAESEYALECPIAGAGHEDEPAWLHVASNGYLLDSLSLRRHMPSAGSIEYISAMQ